MTLIKVMLHTLGRDVTNEAILFHDKLKTALLPLARRFAALRRENLRTFQTIN